MTNQENNRPAFTQDGLPGNPFHNAPGYQQNTYQSHNHQQQPHQDLSLIHISEPTRPY